MTDTIKAELVYYRFNTSRPEGYDAYVELCDTLAKIPFKTWISQSSFPNGATNFKLSKYLLSLQNKLKISLSSADCQLHSREIHLETEYLFEDQWNTAEGFRLHNKALIEWRSRHIKEGYFIRQNDQMIAVLQGTAKCGYCGHMAPVGEKDFCDKCLHSPHLDATELHLLRMEPIEKPERRTEGVAKPSQRAPLTQEELAAIMPRYTEAQTKSQQEKEKKLRADIKRTYERAINIAQTEALGMYWLLDEGISTENLIFYPHTLTFCFGWRNPVSKEVKAVLLEKLKEFPFVFEIKE